MSDWSRSTYANKPVFYYNPIDLASIRLFIESWRWKADRWWRRTEGIVLQG
jgi:hypothetical protein